MTEKKVKVEEPFVFEMVQEGDQGMPEAVVVKEVSKAKMAAKKKKKKGPVSAMD